MSVDYEVYELGNFTLQCGQTIPDCKLAYKTFGTLNATKDNVIVYPTWYSGQHSENEWLVGKGMALDPDKYFIIIPNLLGNGLSSSPSNAPAPYDGPRFPDVTMYDAVKSQHQLITEQFGIETIELVTGWSMGGGQTYQWASQYPDMVKRAAPFQASARCGHFNFVFLEGVKAALTADAAFDHGWYGDTKVNIGLRAMGRVYAGWGLSDPFYTNEEWRAMGYASLEDHLVRFWEGLFYNRDPNNLLSMLSTWQSADISNNDTYGGDLEKALKAITARTYVMPAEHDSYFPPKDNIEEMKSMGNAVLHISPSHHGHFVGGGLCDEDVKWHDDLLKQLLSESV